MPGSNDRALEKAQTLAADALIFDLEDAVVPEAKAAARAKVCEAAGSGNYGRREIIIRCNGLDTPWGADDIAAVAISGAAAILAPKIESAQMVHDIDARMSAAGAPAEQAIWCMMETPLGILRAAEIAAASPRLGCFVMGTSDLVKDLHARHTEMRLPMLTSLSLTILAARAHGLAVLDGVYLGIKDAEGYRAACAQGLELGFDGKTLIHPSQIEAANAAFGLSADDVVQARRVIEAFAAAAAEGKAVAVLDGHLVENLHVDIAQRQVAMAGAIAALDADAAS
jgi:citrate lyase subunit beta/citryl-CoA lyase